MNQLVLRKRLIVKGEKSAPPFRNLRSRNDFPGLPVSHGEKTGERTDFVKQRHVSAFRLYAQETLKALNIGLGQDFHTLTSSQVDGLLREADRIHYQKPAGANGSRGRYFHDRLQRRARAEV